jgi:DNA repair protein RecO (recombination protein O)
LIVKTRAIILNHLRYGESSLIVHLYTESLGRQAIFVKGAFAKKSQMRAALFQPLHLVEIEMHHRANRQMQRISNIRLLQAFHDIPVNPVKNSIALFITELLYKTLREEEGNPELFDFLFHAIQTLDLIETGAANFHLLFMVHLTRYLGFYPNSEGFLEKNLLPFSQLLTLSFEHLDSLKISHQQRNHLIESLLSYYAVHLDNFGQVKSFEVLQHVFL